MNLSLYFAIWLTFAACIFIICYGISSYLYNLSQLLSNNEFKYFGYTMAFLSAILLFLATISLP